MHIIVCLPERNFAVDMEVLEDLISEKTKTEIVKFQSPANIRPNIVAQKAYAKALTGPQNYTEYMRLEYQERRDYFVDALNILAGLLHAHDRLQSLNGE